MNEKIIRIRQVLQAIKDGTQPIDNEVVILEQWNVVDEMLFDLDKAI
jgi:hypothetical protein